MHCAARKNAVGPKEFLYFYQGDEFLLGWNIYTMLINGTTKKPLKKFSVLT